MSRNIPTVKEWRVTYWRDGDRILVVDTCAPDKRFARWNARDMFIDSGVWRDGKGLADEVTVTLRPKDYWYPA